MTSYLMECIRKVRSDPVMLRECPIWKPSTTDLTQTKIYMLNYKTLVQVFSYISFSELTKYRIVCKWFDNVIGVVMNNAFLNLPEVIKKEKENSFINSGPCSYFRTLQILETEINMIDACCRDYILASTFYFTGGIILEIVYDILSRRNSADFSNLTAKLHASTETFLDYFDSHIEPSLLQKTSHLPLSWYGKKIVNIIDCGLIFDKNVKISSNQKQANIIRLVGSYQGRDVYSVKKPPVFSGKSVSFNEMITFVKYLRDNIRWNNLIFIQMNSDEGQYENEIEKSGTTVLIKRYKKVMSSSLKDRHQTKLNISIRMQTLRFLSPRICQELGTTRVCRVDSWESIKMDPDDYKFSVTIEVNCLENDKYVSYSLKLKQVGNYCQIMDAP